VENGDKYFWKKIMWPMKRLNIHLEAQGLGKVGEAYAFFLFKGERAELFWEVRKHANISPR